LENLKNITESLLFVARKPLGPKDILKTINDTEKEEPLQVTEELITVVLEELLIAYQGKGINIVKVAGGYLMGTNSENADYVHRLLHTKVQSTLSPQSLVTLSIIAYKQPITRAEIEKIRGVNTDGPIVTLMSKRLIKEVGRSDAVGAPYLFGTTDNFMRQFGLQSLTDLPPLPSGEEDQEELFETALNEPE
jgi:segregation and condensation protein B